MLIERMLVLLRNVLHVPPTDKDKLVSGKCITSDLQVLYFIS